MKYRHSTILWTTFQSVSQIPFTFSRFIIHLSRCELYLYKSSCIKRIKNSTAKTPDAFKSTTTSSKGSTMDHANRKRRIYNWRISQDFLNPRHSLLFSTFPFYLFLFTSLDCFTSVIAAGCCEALDGKRRSQGTDMADKSRFRITPGE